MMAEILGASRQGSVDVSLCSMRVGIEVFGIDTQQVHEVLGESVVQPVPLAHEFIGGVMSYRGDVLLVLSLRRLLGLQALSGPSNVLVLRDDEEDEMFGLAVDAVDDVMTVAAASFEENPCTLDAQRSAIFAGAYKVQNGVVVCLDSALLRPSRLVELHAE